MSSLSRLSPSLVPLALAALGCLLLAVGPLTASDEAAAPEPMTWTGEVLDLACYVGKGAKGADHAGCAKACVKGGQPMGLLTDDGTVVLLAADHSDGSGFAAAQELAGARADVTGTLAEKDGMKVVTVTGAKAAA